jgi:hypothetical protein
MSSIESMERSSVFVSVTRAHFHLTAFVPTIVELAALDAIVRAVFFQFRAFGANISLPSDYLPNLRHVVNLNRPQQ